ncbi:bidirectional sugar transporter SWEET7b-like [Asparagus officinalis]|uniref:bidirectional sugar transporter SWEET7b-like n=1 Tax=Asparagus officinalis TaxID=4686 RepID=UPI00098DEDE1|nr:bidirectional sugar transporter SWEET7b-like [Asparagus officinalis]
MAIYGAIRTIVGLVGSFFSLALFLAPAPTILDIVANRAVEDYSPWPYFATFINCLLWFFYRLPFVHPGSFLVLPVNMFGVLLQLIYIVVFILCANNPNQRRTLIAIFILELMFFVLVVVLVLSCVRSQETRSTIVGILCIIFGILMYASPLSALISVTRTENLSYMPLMPSLTNLANGICWTIYYSIKFSLYMVIPSAIGIVISVFELIIYARIYFKVRYPKPQPETEQER